ncbi:methylated-DNA--[protein]-cysteine S-methyltransferase [Marinitoga litoralis]|uniref:methylated-DNA--[protein]-cysteine S-methyltransferase n=1 Tax=Marinitoga litoralis TaxID=570855 RepID=UPI001960E665|nr:MGMT family protein [Marinitoga litoralis]MBM7559740.1 methylated-DNA-[protein]-cysteine S-methyltransferase [Marinitoga litoralis]
MNEFIVSTEVGSIIGYVKNNKLVQINLSNDILEEYHDTYTKDFYYKIKEYLKGKDVLEEIPYDIVFRNEFEKRVLIALKGIKFGNVISYKGLAILAGYPNAARAVGTIMAKNRLPLIFPCHRVIKSNGEIGKYGGGEPLKKYLLTIEGLNIIQEKVLKI